MGCSTWSIFTGSVNIVRHHATVHTAAMSLSNAEELRHPLLLCLSRQLLHLPWEGCPIILQKNQVHFSNYHTTLFSALTIVVGHILYSRCRPFIVCLLWSICGLAFCPKTSRKPAKQRLLVRRLLIRRIQWWIPVTHFLFWILPMILCALRHCWIPCMMRWASLPLWYCGRWNCTMYALWSERRWSYVWFGRFRQKYSWNGVSGRAPNKDEYIAALEVNHVFISSYLTQRNV